MSIGEEQVECPLCMEPLELDDLNFFPCTCGYQICRFCWHRIRTDENGLCPACRKAYPEDPAEFKPLTEDELQRIKRERKMKDLQRKQKAAENRKHLANVRVVQKNLVFVVGLSQRLGEAEVLKKHDYFGKYGKIIKVVINQSTSYAGSQGPSASAYVTYMKPEDALRAIQAVNNIHVDGRTLKASLGTTKYCSHFLRGTQCPKSDCMYLHELGDEHASFTKEEMQQGKHQEYEQKLYEHYMNNLNNVNLSNQTSSTQTNKQGHTSRKKSNSPASSTQSNTPPPSASQNTNTEAWPSLQPGQGGKPPQDSSAPTQTHKRSTSTDLQNRHTPDSSNRPSPQSDSCSTSSSISSSSSSNTAPQVSPPHTHTPPLHRNTDNITQVPPTSRKSLYGEPAQDNMSLFSSSGYPVTRKLTKPPPPPGLTHPSVNPAPVTTFTEGGPQTQQHTEGQEIPDTISVSSSTDWQAAFGFHPSTLTSQMNPTQNRHTHDIATDDDLGFDPWNESTKALQDLIEKESFVRPSHTTNQQPHTPANQLPSASIHPQQQLPPHLVAPDRIKNLPPGFTPNHISAFNQNPLLGGSRMMNLMKLQPQGDLPASGGGLQSTHNGGADPFNMKSWQEGLRALLPNINIHFGLPGGPQIPQAGQSQMLPPHLQQKQQMLQQQQQQAALSQQQKQHSHNSWDMYDPAIVTSRQLADANNLLDEPHWMASLQHLTEEPANQNMPHNTHSKFLPMGLNPVAPPPPPGFQNAIRPQLASAGLDPHKLMDGFQ